MHDAGFYLFRIGISPVLSHIARHQAPTDYAFYASKIDASKTNYEFFIIEPYDTVATRITKRIC